MVEEVDYDAGRVLEALNDKVDRDFGNVPSNFVNFAKYSKNVTNCITEIPQDIKLELNNGTLTLKAGSKVYVPNGFEADGVTPKFDVVVVESDLIGTTGDEGDYTYCVSSDAILTATYTERYFSGSTAPSSPVVGNIWFDTSTNLVKRYKDNAWVPNFSFPICIARTSEIKQIFNGFGYIGSTVFALPGVKGLIPNGRNADGSLKNIEVVTSKVRVRSDINPNVSGFFALNGTFDHFIDWGISYELTDDNYLNTSYGNKVSNVVSGLFVTDSSGKITSFNPKTAFQAVDRNDSSWVSAQAMPSGKYIDLTIGASGSTYTAPANGYFWAGNSNGSIRLLVNNMSISSNLLSNYWGGQAFIPVKKGYNVYFYYSDSATQFRFIYAEGE